MSEPAATVEATVPGRERLLAAAACAFSRNGYAATSIARVSRAAGMSKSTVFHHFPSKEALYLAVIEEAVQAFAERLDDVLSHSTDLETALLRFQTEHIKHLDRHRQIVRLILRELQDPALSDQRGPVLELLSTNVSRLADHLGDAQADGRIRASADTRIAALVLFAANAFYFQHAAELEATTALPFEHDAERFAASVVDLVTRGLVPPSDPENSP
jgi:TetR/AcrR family transcriptional regulator